VTLATIPKAITVNLSRKVERETLAWRNDWLAFVVVEELSL